MKKIKLSKKKIIIFIIIICLLLFIKFLIISPRLEEKRCGFSGGAYTKLFELKCVDTCPIGKGVNEHFGEMWCDQSCDCGEGKCWNGIFCSPNNLADFISNFTNIDRFLLYINPFIFISVYIVLTLIVVFGYLFVSHKRRKKKLVNKENNKKEEKT